MQSMLDPQEIVDDCEDMYRDAYRDVAKRDRDGQVISDLQQDLAKMSNQPAIKYDFRRFVVIKSTADVHGRPGEEDWVSGGGSTSFDGSKLLTCSPILVRVEAGFGFQVYGRG
jgi:hypothetical protein